MANEPAHMAEAIHLGNTWKHMENTWKHMAEVAIHLGNNPTWDSRLGLPWLEHIKHIKTT